MEHIDILFKEYDILRQELISRTNNGFQMATIVSAVGVGLVTWIFGAKPHWLLWASIVGLVVITFVITSFGWLGEMNWIDTRLCELEKQINDLAGKELLKWETHWVKGRRKPWSVFKKLSA